MDWHSIYGAITNILNCLSAQYPNVKTLVAAAASIVGGATLLWKVGQTQTAGAINGLLPPVLAKVFSGLGGILGKIGLKI